MMKLAKSVVFLGPLLWATQSNAATIVVTISGYYDMTEGERFPPTPINQPFSYTQSYDTGDVSPAGVVDFNSYSFEGLGSTPLLPGEPGLAGFARATSTGQQLALQFSGSCPTLCRPPISLDGTFDLFLTSPFNLAAPGPDILLDPAKASTARVTFGDLSFRTLSGFVTGFSYRVGAASPVPEPSSWALMLVGFGAVGMAMRGRRGRGLAVAPSVAA